MAGMTDRRDEPQQQQQHEQGQEVGDGAVRPPALDRVSIASAIGEQYPKLSRCAAPSRCSATYVTSLNIKPGETGLPWV